MRPYQHAVSSAASFGGQWQDYIEIHEFLDSTKAACSDNRHRMILHSVDLGAALAGMLFPDRDDIDLIVRQHVLEDVGTARTLSEWLQLCRRTQLPRLHPDALPIDMESMVAGEAARSRISDDTQIRKICGLLLLPLQFSSDFGPDALCVVGNSFGPALVRRIFGPPIKTDGTFFDPALSAERMIYGLYRAVPPMIAVVQALLSSHQSETRS